MQTLPHQSHIFLTFCPIWSPQKEMRNTVHCTISPWQINRSQAVIHHMFQTAVHLSITASLCKLSLCLGVPTVGPSPWNPQWCILDTLSKAAAQTRAPSKGAPLLQQNWGRGDAEKRVTAGLTQLIWEKKKQRTYLRRTSCRLSNSPWLSSAGGGACDSQSRIFTFGFSFSKSKWRE